MKNIFFILFLLFWACGCVGRQTQSESSAADEATAACILKCQGVRTSEDLGKGPCLSNEIKPDWVCDIAHTPRHLEDNKPENQCIAFGESRAHHFIELNENCELIKAV